MHVVRVVGIASMLALVGACPAEPLPPRLPPVSAGKAKIRVFTEPAAARAIATVDGSVLVATDNGLEQWDATGHVEAVDTLIARVVVADGDAAWLVTDTGIVRFTPATRQTDTLPAPPDVDVAAITAIVAANTEGDAYVGTPMGVLLATADGWQPTPITDPVRALLRDAAGTLWVATDAGVVSFAPNGDVARLSEDDGFGIVDVRVLAAAPGDRIVAAGGDATGHERIAIGRGRAWTTFRTLPSVRLDASVRHNNTVIARGGDRLYRLAPNDGIDRPLSRDGIRLVPISTAATIATTESWTIDPIDVVLPPGAIALGAIDDQLLVGTRELGTARYRDGDRHPRDWLRRRAMFVDATGLAVACTAREDCWLATGARRAWHWTGDRFVAAGPSDDDVLTVVRDPSNVVYALHRAPSEPTAIRISRLDNATWTPLPRLALSTPGDLAELVFARFGAAGKLWVWLRYREDDAMMSYGVAIVEPAAGRVSYRDTDHGMPVGAVAADVRGATAWVATDDAVVRVTPTASTSWTTADGLRGDLRAISVAPSGDVVVATRIGAGVFDGRSWEFPAALRFEVNDLVATRSGAWMATERGVVAWDGRNLRRFDVLRGLAENEVLDVAADQYDRIWARGPGSLTLITQ